MQVGYWGVPYEIRVSTVAGGVHSFGNAALPNDEGSFADAVHLVGKLSLSRLSVPVRVHAEHQL